MDMAVRAKASAYLRVKVCSEKRFLSFFLSSSPISRALHFISLFPINLLHPLHLIRFSLIQRVSITKKSLFLTSTRVFQVFFPLSCLQLMRSNVI